MKEIGCPLTMGKGGLNGLEVNDKGGTITMGEGREGEALPALPTP